MNGERISWISAQGLGGQRLYIVPRYDLVAVIAAGLYAGDGQDWVPHDLFDKHVLAAIRK
jgi:hypothetical protein